jgi:hypothetical protein
MDFLGFQWDAQGFFLKQLFSAISWDSTTKNRRIKCLFHKKGSIDPSNLEHPIENLEIFRVLTWTLLAW